MTPSGIVASARGEELAHHVARHLDLVMPPSSWPHIEPDASRIRMAALSGEALADCAVAGEAIASSASAVCAEYGAANWISHQISIVDAPPFGRGLNAAPDE